VPKGEASGNHDADEDADQEENTVSGKSDQQDSDYGDGDNERSGAAQSETEAGLAFGGHSGAILARKGNRETAAFKTAVCRMGPGSYW